MRQTATAPFDTLSLLRMLGFAGDTGSQEKSSFHRGCAFGGLISENSGGRRRALFSALLSSVYVAKEVANQNSAGRRLQGK